MIKIIRSAILIIFTLIITACRDENSVACKIAAPFTIMTDEQSVLLEKKKVLAMSSPVNATQYQQTDSKLPTIINFWASWCKPCRDELPFLQSISKEKIANVILINVGDSNQIASNMLTELNVNSVKTRAADDEILSRLKFHGLPITLVYKDNQDRFIGAGKLKKQKQISDWLTCKN